MTSLKYTNNNLSNEVVFSHIFSFDCLFRSINQFLKNIQCKCLNIIYHKNDQIILFMIIFNHKILTKERIFNQRARNNCKKVGSQIITNTKLKINTFSYI